MILKSLAVLHSTTSVCLFIFNAPCLIPPACVSSVSLYPVDGSSEGVLVVVDAEEASPPLLYLRGEETPTSCAISV